MLAELPSKFLKGGNLKFYDAFKKIRGSNGNTYNI
jgi:hypothetical protein